MRLSLPRLKMPRLETAASAGNVYFRMAVRRAERLGDGLAAKDTDSLVMYDRMLLWLTFGLAAIGFIMVTGVDAGRSASG